MKSKILGFLQVFCLLFFMIMGIFFVLAGILYWMGLPLTNERLLLAWCAACLIEYGYYLWVREW